MKTLLSNLNIYFSEIPARLRKYRWLIWLLFIAMSVFMIKGMSRNTFEMTLDSWFSKNDPVKLSLDRFRDEFGSDDGIFIVYKPKDGDVFSHKSLTAVRSIREELLDFDLLEAKGTPSMLKHINRVETITSIKILQVEDETLVSKHLTGDFIPIESDALNKIRQTAMKQKDLPLLYFSKDSQYGGIFIETDFGTIPLDVDDESNMDSDGEYDESNIGSDDEYDEIIVEAPVNGEINYKQTQPRFKTTTTDEYLNLMEEINNILQKSQFSDHLDYYPVGNAPLTQANMEIMKELGPMFLGMILIMMMLLWILFRSLSAVIWPVTIVVLTSIWSIGISGWMGTTFSNMLTLSIMLILAVGIADSIHILSAYLHHRKEITDHYIAMKMTFEKAVLPCLLTSATTMIGLLALLFTPIKQIQVFGYTSAMGVGLAFFLSITLLPLMMDLWSPVSKNEKNPEEKLKGLKNLLLPYLVFKKLLGKLFPDFSKVLQKWLSRILLIVERRPVSIILIFGAIFVGCLYGASQVKVDSNLVEQVKRGTPLRTAYEVVDTYMMGTQNLEIFINMGTEDSLTDPKVLKAMEKLQMDIIAKYPELVIRTHSLVDVVKEAYQVLNNDREDMYIIPKNQRTISQTLFLFDNSDPEDRARLVSGNYSKSHISIQLHNAGSYEYTQFFKAVQEDIVKTFAHLKTDYPEMDISLTGGLALLMELAEYITWSQLKSFGLTLLIISIMLFFIVGSIRMGFISIWPNLIPATLTFGLLGIFGLSLDAKTIVIAPVIIGIAVDDTIHFITHYRMEIMKHGAIKLALHNTLQEVGQAITYTSLILGLGFSILAFSSLTAFVKMGVFGALAIFMALLCDLFLLPALILVFKPKLPIKSSANITLKKQIKTA
jgi:uncharacterized protein